MLKRHTQQCIRPPRTQVDPRDHPPPVRNIFPIFHGSENDKTQIPFEMEMLLDFRSWRIRVTLSGDRHERKLGSFQRI